MCLRTKIALALAQLTVRSDSLVPVGLVEEEGHETDGDSETDERARPTSEHLPQPRKTLLDKGTAITQRKLMCVHENKKDRANESLRMRIWWTTQYM